MLRWLLVGGAALVAFLAMGNLLAALPAAAVAYVVPGFYVKHCQARRLAKFDDQLVEAIQLLGSTLKSGYSFLQGVEAVAREMPAPISEEFDRMVKEIGVGARADGALQDMIDRVRSDDLELVITAMMIQRQVGGELAGILETIAKTIRERQKIKRDVNTLTAQQRWSGYIIGAMPFALLALINYLNPSYSSELLFTFHGQMMMVVALIMEGIGFVMIRKIIQIEV
ncbi:MAG: type II secretion system F family protein, partial [Chloroflexota bacterium]